jgi:hypothetical protein
MEIVLLLTCSTCSGMGSSKGWANRAAARGANTSLESSEILCWCTQLFYMRKTFSKIIRNLVRALKNIRQPCPKPKKLEECRLKGR